MTTFSVKTGKVKDLPKKYIYSVLYKIIVQSLIVQCKATKLLNLHLLLLKKSVINVFLERYEDDKKR